MNVNSLGRSKKEDWSALLAIILVVLAFYFGGIWIGFGVFLILSVALGWSKRRDGPFITDKDTQGGAR